MGPKNSFSKTTWELQTAFLKSSRESTQKLLQEALD
jgi:hypothetical protein